MTPLRDFDFSVLNHPSFKEDSVREEILAPILKALGYRPSGRFRVERSRNLPHPFVMLGSKKHPVKIVPDYTLFVDDTPVMVLDAKAPFKAIVKSEHVEQVYSYAIHPDVRCERYGLCNGRELVIFSTKQWDPLVRVNLEHLDSNWDDICCGLDPVRLQPPREDLYTAWFHLLGVLVSPSTGPHIAANAAYRLSWYMPSVVDSRRASAEAAMRNLSDAQLLAILRAAGYLFSQLDGTPAEHVGYLLSYDKGMHERLAALLKARTIPRELVSVTIQLVEMLGEGPRPDL